MRCEKFGEILVHEDEKVDGTCWTCERKTRATTARHNDHKKVINIVEENRHYRVAGRKKSDD